jgi:hypothetical protein
VVAAGLSGAFSSLPRKLLIVSDDWFQIGDDDVAQSVSLKQFLDMFDFCNAIVQVGSFNLQIGATNNSFVIVFSRLHVYCFAVLCIVCLNIFKPKANFKVGIE